jgi:hypothetical protein
MIFFSIPPSVERSLCHLTARTRRNPKKVKAASRPQYYRIKRIVDMVREGSAEGYLPSRSDFRRQLEVSPRTPGRFHPQLDSAVGQGHGAGNNNADFFHDADSR